MNRRILVVDDDPDIREIAAFALGVREGWTILQAADGKSAEAVALREQPDLILLDYMMPDQDGATTLRALKANEQTRNVPVIILTAKIQTGLKEILLAEGALGILQKPFDPIGLPDDVARLAGWDG